MVQAKTALFDTNIQQAALLYKALGHPARLQILRYLAQTKMCITGNISDVLPLSRTTVNQHLTELKKAGLIRGHVSGKNTSYCLNPSMVKELQRVSELFLKEIDSPFYECR
ncbi:MAG: helix-turn-helix transcriptional regulator [Prolixibacteraceae bacterium]|nr:helix-turn-helix transcriptional regulator [Prolixibacteraceae bacterium]MBN2648490.1 helix-turn-helix transcriptional regulator [Prolixibacteraceae bacterium]